jgi:hypothetical protein
MSVKEENKKEKTEIQTEIQKLPNDVWMLVASFLLPRNFLNRNFWHFLSINLQVVFREWSQFRRTCKLFYTTCISPLKLFCALYPVPDNINRSKLAALFLRYVIARNVACQVTAHPVNDDPKDHKRNLLKKNMLNFVKQIQDLPFWTSSAMQTVTSCNDPAQPGANVVFTRHPEIKVPPNDVEKQHKIVFCSDPTWDIQVDRLLYSTNHDSKSPKQPQSVYVSQTDRCESKIDATLDGQVLSVDGVSVWWSLAIILLPPCVSIVPPVQLIYSRRILCSPVTVERPDNGTPIVESDIIIKQGYLLSL